MSTGTATAAPAVNTTDRRIAFGIGVVVAAFSLPFAFDRPGLILDDWFPIYHSWYYGLWHVADRAKLMARPGEWVTLFVEFGIIGRHPLVIHFIELALMGVAGALFYLACRRFLPRWQAGCAAAIWGLLPNHATLDHWASGLTILIAVVVTLTGIVLLERAVERESSWWPAVALLALSPLWYEVTLPACAAALVVIPRLMTRRWDLRRALPGLVIIGAVGAWMLRFSQHLHQHDFTGWFDVKSVFPDQFGWGLTPSTRAAHALAFVAFIGLALALAGRVTGVLKAVPRDAAPLVAGGIVIIAVGILPFLRYPIQPVGIGDRANAVASFGGALAWTGLLTLLGRWRAALVAAAALFVVLVVPMRSRVDHDYADAGHDAGRILQAITVTAKAHPGQEIMVGPTPVFHHSVVGVIGEIPQASQAWGHTRGIYAVVAVTPQDWNGAPNAVRLDIHRVIAR